MGKSGLIFKGMVSHFSSKDLFWSWSSGRLAMESTEENLGPQIERGWGTRLSCGEIFKGMS